MFPVTLSRAHGGQVRRVLIVALATLLLIGVTAIIPGTPGDREAHAAAWVGNSLKKHEVWDPAPAVMDWVPGHPKGYTEGETAAFRVTIEADAGEQLMFHACLDFDDSGAYAFTGIDPWDASYTTMTPPPVFGDLTGDVVPGFNGAGLTIDSATSLGEGSGLCPANYLAWEISFTMTTTGIGYVVYGGHIAAPGDPLPGGGTVPDGQGASAATGVFQARVETEGGGDKTVNFSPDNITPLVPGIDIEKATNGEDADSAPGPYVPVGDAVTWTYVVTNTGQPDLVNVGVSDDVLGAVSCPKDVLAAGETMTCTATGTASAGQYTNLGSVTGIDAAGTTVEDEDPSHYYGLTSSIDIEKATNGEDADSAPGPYVPVGDAVTWTYVVTNGSNVAVSGIAVSDDVLGAVSCPKDVLAAGETMTCTATGTASAGQYTNLGSVTGIDAAGTTVEDEDPSHYYGLTSSIDIEKATNGEDADSAPGPYVPVGDAVTWTYVVTNGSNVAVSGIAVSDDVLGAVSCPKDVLAAGETMTCTATGTASAGQYTNLGSVTGIDAAGTTVEDEDPSHYYGLTSSIDIEKATNGEDADSAPGPYVPVGDAVTWTYVVTNGSNVAVSGIAVSDDVLGAVSCPKDVLAAGETMTCTATGTASAGQYTNLGSVTGIDAAGTTVEDEDPSHYYGLTSSIDIEKATNGEDADSAPGPYVPVGDAVTWTYVVTNGSNVAVSGIAVSDDVLGAVSCPKDVLAAGETMTCTATGTASAGQYTNLGSVTGIDAAGTTVEDEDPSHYYGLTSSIDIEKYTNGEDADTPTGPFIPVGGSVEWVYLVQSTGNAPLNNVVVTDDQGVNPVFANGDDNTNGLLDPGEIWVYKATGTASAGQYTNLGSVTGIDAAGTTVEDEDPSHYYGLTSSIDIEKATNGEDADSAPGPYVPVGDAVTWTYVVTNGSNVAVSGIAVSDDVLGAVSCPKDVLAAGETMTCTATGTASAGQYTNLGSVTGIDAAGTTVEDEDPSHYYGLTSSIDIEKYTNGEDADTPTGPFIPVGGSVEWVYLVQSTGNAPLNNVVVTDDQGVNPVFANGDDNTNGLLDPGEIWVYKATGTASAGQYTNLGSVTGIDAAGTTVEDEDPSHYYGLTSSIDIEKTGAFGIGDDGIASPGDLITYEFEVTNNGNGALTDIDVEDLDLGGVDVACPKTALAVDETMTCTATYPVTQDDINAGSVDNCAVAAGLDPREAEVSDEDCAETDIPQSPAIDVVKSAEPGILSVGEVTEVTWTIEVTNMGNVPLSEVTISDALVATCDLAIGDLAVAASTTQTCTSTHTPDGLSWTFTNVAVAAGVGPDGTEVTANDDAKLAPIEVLGTAQLGDTVWLDTNKNGLQDSGEPGINGARVVLTDAAGTVVGTATTAKGPWDGWYKFVGLDAGRYTATLDTTSVSGALTTAGAFTVNLAEGQEYLLADFGVAETLPKTGMDSGVLAWLGVGLLILGGIALLATRRRRSGQE